MSMELTQIGQARRCIRILSESSNGFGLQNGHLIVYGTTEGRKGCALLPFLRSFYQLPDPVIGEKMRANESYPD